MAWGCFCWIPCPYKKWNEDDRTAMVAMLPLVGTGLGLCTALVWWVLSLLGAAPILSGAVVTGAYFVMTGFIHLDGFMDVCDAVMPRHPEQEARIRILKDPHTGSFAAVSMALMLLIFGASAAALSAIWAPGALALIAVATTSRCISAVTVLTCRPMQTSQYASGDFGSRKGWLSVQTLPALVITVLVVAGCTVAAAYVIEPEMGGIPVPVEACVPVSAAVCAITALIIGTLDRRSLGGMNGDISGHMITSGEMAGLLAAALLIGQS